MSRLLQIHESDLADLERIIPQLTEHVVFASESTSPAMRTSIRRLQKILTDVRWNYQPHTEIQKVE